MPAVRPRSAPESSEPPSSGKSHDSTRPLKNELNYALGIVKDAADKHATLVATIQQLNTELAHSRTKTEWQEQELARLKQIHRDSVDDDKRRDDRIKVLETELDRWAKLVAPKVADINRPQTEADGAAGAATVINKARYWDYAWKFAMGLVAIVLAVLQAMNADKVKPTQEIPIPTVPAATAGVQR